MQSKATNAPSPQHFISRADAAKLLGMTVQFVDKKIADGTLPYYRFGRSVRLRRDEFEKWVAGKRVQL
jgi:excisionase family DNA binding protein